jgi:hypothetical protein
MFVKKAKIEHLSPDQNADPDEDPETQENADPEPGIPKLQIQCGSRFHTLTLTPDGDEDHKLQ